MAKDNTDPGNHPGPGGYNPGPDKPAPPSSTGVVTTFKQQNFNIICRGMKPKTVHKFYYEGVDRGSDCRPIKPKSTTGQTTIGSPLITDDEGFIEFSFYYTLDVEKQVDASNKVKYDVAGDKKFELVAVDSTAAKIVPMSVHYVSNPPPPSPSPDYKPNFGSIFTPSTPSSDSHTSP